MYPSSHLYACLIIHSQRKKTCYWSLQIINIESEGAYIIPNRPLTGYLHVSLMPEELVLYVLGEHKQ